MVKRKLREARFEDEGDEQDVAEKLSRNVRALSVQGTDWTTEVLATQLERGNIKLNPQFQRRDAWKLVRKSRFIESLIVGLPIPQIILAESKQDRGKFFVLDGKQRLLAISQFWGNSKGTNNGYALEGLTLREDLEGTTFAELSDKAELESDFNVLCNQPIRTIVVRNWKDLDILHTIFLRLNTGSVKLSPQELRQALLPGPFSTYADGITAKSKSLQELLGLEQPDTRMRDIEIFARFLAFRFFADEYPGRLRAFLDDAFDKFNKDWETYSPKVDAARKDFEAGIDELLVVFDGNIARKPTSEQFNRAIFDALIYYHSQTSVRRALLGKRRKVSAAYDRLFSPGSDFLKAVESDTAGAPNTGARLRIWGKVLSEIAGQKFAAPAIPQASSGTPRRAARKKRPKEGRLS